MCDKSCACEFCDDYENCPEIDEDNLDFQDADPDPTGAEEVWRER